MNEEIIEKSDSFKKHRTRSRRKLSNLIQSQPLSVMREFEEEKEIQVPSTLYSKNRGRNGQALHPKRPKLQITPTSSDKSLWREQSKQWKTRYESQQSERQKLSPKTPQQHLTTQQQAFQNTDDSRGRINMSQALRNGSEDRSQMQVVGQPRRDLILEDILSQYNDININPPSSSHNVRRPSLATNFGEESKAERAESLLSKQYPIVIIKESELFKTKNQKSQFKPDTIKKLPKQERKKQVIKVESPPSKSPIQNTRAPIKTATTKKQGKAKKSKKKQVQQIEEQKLEEQESMKQLDKILSEDVSEQEIRILSQRQKYKHEEEIKEQPEDHQELCFNIKYRERISRLTLDHADQQSDNKTQIHSPATDNRIFMSQDVSPACLTSDPIASTRKDKMKIISSNNQSSQQQANLSSQQQLIDGTRSHNRTPDTTQRNISSNRGLLFDRDSNRGAQVLDQMYDILSENSRKTAYSKKKQKKQQIKRKISNDNNESQVKIPKRTNRLKLLDEIQPTAEEKLPIIDIDTSQMNSKESEYKNDTSEFYRGQPEPNKRVSFIQVSQRTEKQNTSNSKIKISTVSLSKSLSISSQTLDTKSPDSTTQNVILSKPMSRKQPTKKITGNFKNLVPIRKSTRNSLHFPMRKKSGKKLDKLQPDADDTPGKMTQMTFKITDINKRNSVKKMLIYHKLDEERRANISIHEDLRLEPVFYVQNSDKYKQLTTKQKKMYNVQSQLFGMDLVTAQKERLIESLHQKMIAGSFIFKKLESFTKKNRKNSINEQKSDKSGEGGSSDEEKVMEKWQKSKKGIKSCEACLSSMVIRRDSAWKGVFDIIMLFVSCYNIFSNLIYSAFGIPTTFNFLVSDNIIEGLYWLDIIFNFCTEYLDHESVKVVDDLKSIALHYVKGTFFVDFIACLPLSLFIKAIQTENSVIEDEQIRLFRLIKFLRLPRLAELLNVQRFQSLVVAYYDKQLIDNINKGHYDRPFPILRAQQYIFTFKMSQLVILIFSCSFFTGIIWLICVRDIQDWQNLSLYDVYNSFSSFISNEDYGFEIDLDNQEVISQQSYESLIKLWYYGLTTLTTIGYGDFLPKSVNEKIMISIIMFLGNSIFSYITGKFITILSDYKELEQYGEQANLNLWMALIKKISTDQNNTIQRDQMLSIQDFFNYFWNENPHAAFDTQSGKGFKNSLTVGTIQQIYLEYLFMDFLYKYGSYLRYQKFGRIVSWQNQKFRKFLVMLVEAFEPRNYPESYGTIQEQFQEVYEILYVAKGSLLIGYRIFNDLFFAKHYNQDQIIVGDFSVLNNKVSEYLYRSFEEIHGFAIKRHNFIKIFKTSIGRKIKPQINQKYVDEIRMPVNKHRSMMSKKFSQRIDYVDLAAFGVGVISDDKDQFAEESKAIQETIQKYSSSYGRLISRLKTIDKYFRLYEYEIAAMAQRYDQRIQNQLLKDQYDKFQIELVEKMFNKAQYMAKREMIKQMKVITKVNLKVESSMTLGLGSFDKSNLKKNDDLMHHVAKNTQDRSTKDRSQIRHFIDMQLKASNNSKLLADQKYRMKKQKLMEKQSDQLSKLSELSSVSLSSNSQEVFKSFKGSAFNNKSSKSSFHDKFVEISNLAKLKFRSKQENKGSFGPHALKAITNYQDNQAKTTGPVTFGPQALKLAKQKSSDKVSQKSKANGFPSNQKQEDDLALSFEKNKNKVAYPGTGMNLRMSQTTFPQDLQQLRVEEGSSDDSP